jgi:hypothetical protein
VGIQFYLGTDHLTCRGGWLWGDFPFRIFFRPSREFFSPEFNIKLYEKNSESDCFLLHQNQNIFSATLRIRIFFLEKQTITPKTSANVDLDQLIYDETLM